MTRAYLLAGLSLFITGNSWGFEEAAVANRNRAVIIKQLETGDWNARIHAVHELDYMQSEGLPGLARATDDGDWQVRMTAVHAIGSRGVEGASILKRLLKYEPCPVVRLMTLHSLGSLGPEGEEAKAMGWISEASSQEVNACQDQPGPGLASWARTKRPKRTAPVAPEAERPHQERVMIRPVEPDIAVEAEEEDEIVVTRDPVPPVAPTSASTRRNPSHEALPAPTKYQRHTELDAMLDLSTQAIARQGVELEMIGRSTGPRENLPWPVAPIARQHVVSAPGLIMNDAGGKAAHDALPALIRALRRGDVRTRARAADDLGHLRAAAAVPALLTALHDRASSVRSSAGLALGNIGTTNKSVVPLLTKALRDRSEDVRYAAALALSRIDTPAARKAFKRHVGKEARRAIDRPKTRDKTTLR